jgi:pilus assembly protein FimV
MCKALLTAVTLTFLASAPAWAQQSEVPGQAGKLGTGATGGAPSATAGSGTQGGPPPSQAEPGGGTTEGQGTAAQANKAGTGAAAGAPGAAAAPGAEGGCPPGKQPEPGQAVPSTC